MTLGLRASSLSRSEPKPFAAAAGPLAAHCRACSCSRIRSKTAVRRNITRRPILNPGGPSPLWCNQRNVSDTGMNWEGPDVYIDGGVTNYWTTPAQADWQS
jgi:hypothetical protein